MYTCRSYVPVGGAARGGTLREGGRAKPSSSTVPSEAASVWSPVPNLTSVESALRRALTLNPPVRAGAEEEDGPSWNSPRRGFGSFSCEE
jgi:hypothetical protein